ncbi:MAG: ribosome maturation factor RimP [Candidatus Acidiferrales bacterium]
MGVDVERIREAAERVARSLGLEIVDVEWKVGKQRFLRVYIDKPVGAKGHASSADESLTSDGLGAPVITEGVGHRDCEAVSHQLSVILDVEELVPGPSYVLEVSSPGLDRKLAKPAEFERFAGRRAKIYTFAPVEGQSFFDGRLAGFADGRVAIDVGEKRIAVPFEAIRKAQLVVEF